MFQACAGKCDCVCMESERTRGSKGKIGDIINLVGFFKINLLFIGILLGVFLH